MALAETAELAVKLSLDDSQFGRAIGRIDKRLGAFSGAINRNLGKAVDSAALFAVRHLTGAFEGGIAALKADAVQSAQTAAVIKSTGGVAGVTAQQVADLADKYSILNGVQDDVVQHVENVLLTFTKIGKDIFPDVTQAALDMSAALGTDTQGAALQLGKALQDPIKGVTALRRAGVSLDEQQIKTIKSLVKQGRLHEAQAIILKEVAKEFGGVAKAQADADPSKRYQIAVEKLQKALASGLLPVVEKVQLRLTEFLSKPETLATLKQFGDAIAGLFTDQNLSAIASGLSVAASAVSTAISAFSSLPPEIKALAIGAFAVNKVTGGAVGGIASAFGKILGAGLQKIFAANVTVIGTNVIGAGGGLPGGAPVPTAAAGAGGKLVGLVSKVLIVGMAAEVAIELSKALGLGLGNRPELPADQLSWPWGPKNTPDINWGPLEHLLGGDSALSKDSGGPGITGGQGPGRGTSTAPVVKAIDKTKGAVNTLGKTTTTAIEGLGSAEIAATRAQHEKDRAKLEAVKQKQQQSLIAFRAGERASLTGNSIARTANAKLDAIRHKKTSFTTNVKFIANTSVTVRDYQAKAGVSSKVIKGTIAQAG